MGEVVVVTGTGGMGTACARRLVQGRKVVLVEIDGAKLSRFAQDMSEAGHEVVALQADVSDAQAMGRVAQEAATCGNVAALVHTAGISGTMADADRIFEVNLLGTANVIAAFEPVMEPGGAAVCIASMGAITIPMDPAFERQIARASASEQLQMVKAIRKFHPVEAYCVSKRVNRLQIAFAAMAWGKRGLRINSISPGLISTPMIRAEEKAVKAIELFKQISPVPRMGTPEDIAAAAEYLLGPHAGYISGTDLAVDGGLIAAQLYGEEITL